MLEMATQSTDVVKPSKCFAATMIFCVASVNLISSMTSGLITIALPTLVQDLSIPPSLMFWYLPFALPIDDGTAKLTEVTGRLQSTP